MRRVGFFVFAVAILIGVRVFIGNPQTSSVPAQSTPTPTATASNTATPLPVIDVQATAFLKSYLGYLYGKNTLAQVVNVTASARQGLPSTLQNFTPQEQTRSYSIETEQTTTPEGGSSAGSALIQEGGGLASYTINFTMSEQNGVWLVDSVPTFSS